MESLSSFWIITFWFSYFGNITYLLSIFLHSLVHRVFDMLENLWAISYQTVNEHGGLKGVTERTLTEEQRKMQPRQSMAPNWCFCWFSCKFLLQSLSCHCPSGAGRVVNPISASAFHDLANSWHVHRWLLQVSPNCMAIPKTTTSSSSWQCRRPRAGFWHSRQAPAHNLLQTTPPLLWRAGEQRLNELSSARNPSPCML